MSGNRQESVISYHPDYKRNNRFLGHAHPMKDFTLGVGIDYLTAGEIEETTETEPRGTGKMLRAEDDTAVFLSLSKRMKENLSLGMNIKYIKQEVADENAAGLGADLGLLYKFPRLNFGLAIQNFGADTKLVKEEFRLPFNIKMGLAYKGIKNTTLAIDMNLPSDNRMRTNLGGEYWVGNILALRAGYNSSVSRNKLDKFNLGEGISAGFGVKKNPSIYQSQIQSSLIHLLILSSPGRSL